MVETIPDPSPSASQKCRSLGQHARDLFILSRYDRYNPLLATFSGVWGTFLAGCSKCEAYPGSITRTDVFQQALLVFISGYIFCGAGMVWNDWVDLSIDRQVARTRLRPLAAGRVTTGEALSWMIVQYITSWLLVAYTLGNQKVQEAMIPITISSLLYPFGKRRFFKVVHVYPQYFLGFTLGYPSLIGWLAIKGQDQPLRESIIESAGLGITVLTWVLYLNTAYSYQDIEGDKKAKVNSIYFLAGSYIRGFLTILAVLVIAALSVQLRIQGSVWLWGSWFFVWLLSFISQLSRFSARDSDSGGTIHKDNFVLGLWTVLACAVEVAVRC